MTMYSGEERRPATRQARAALLKAVLDTLVALLLLVLLAPLLLVITAALWCDGGQVLVRQERVGVHGRRFRTFAFRSTGARVGPFLRRNSLVNLPQLLNVIGGSMSLVGPSAPLAGEIAPDADVRRAPVVKPGLTGLPEPCGAVRSWEDVVALELSYAENWTPALDARILAQSVRIALHGHKAA